MPPLDAAVALTEVNAIPVLIDEHLDLDVATLLDPLLEVDRVVSKGGLRLGSSQRQRGLHLARCPHQPHASATTTGRWLEQHRVAGLLRLGQGVAEVAHDPAAAGDGGQAIGSEHAANRVLAGEALEHLRAWADEVQVVRGAHLRKAGVLREEPVAGMDRVTAGDEGGGYERGLVQVAAPGFCGTDADGLVGEAHAEGVSVGFRISEHRGHAQVAACPQDPHGDLAAIRDQDLAEHQTDAFAAASVSAAARRAAMVC